MPDTIVPVGGHLCPIQSSLKALLPFKKVACPPFSKKLPIIKGSSRNETAVIPYTLM